MMNNQFYYLLVEEWNYPTESGREVIDSTFNGDELEEALEYAKSKCLQESANFAENIKGDVLPPNMLDNEGGYIITSKMGLDNYHYAVRIVTMKKL